MESFFRKKTLNEIEEERLKYGTKYRNYPEQYYNNNNDDGCDDEMEEDDEFDDENAPQWLKLQRAKDPSRSLKIIKRRQADGKRSQVPFQPLVG